MSENSYNEAIKKYKRGNEKPLKELIAKAEEIIKNKSRDGFERMIECSANGVSLNDKDSENFPFIKYIDSFCIGGSRYSFQKAKIVEALIRKDFDLQKSIKLLLKERESEEKEKEIQNKILDLKYREKQKLIRQEAEKRLYGKNKTQRQSFTEEEKEIIFDRYNHQCAICGNNEGLHIHHRDCNPSNNKLDNLILLCGVCHKKIHMKVR